jgi:hypothetical protein
VPGRAAGTARSDSRRAEDGSTACPMPASGLWNPYSFEWSGKLLSASPGQVLFPSPAPPERGGRGVGSGSRALRLVGTPCVGAGDQQRRHRRGSSQGSCRYRWAPGWRLSGHRRPQRKAMVDNTPCTANGSWAAVRRERVPLFRDEIAALEGRRTSTTGNEMIASPADRAGCCCLPASATTPRWNAAAAHRPDPRHDRASLARCFMEESPWKCRTWSTPWPPRHPHEQVRILGGDQSGCGTDAADGTTPVETLKMTDAALMGRPCARQSGWAVLLGAERMVQVDKYPRTRKESLYDEIYSICLAYEPGGKGCSRRWQIRAGPKKGERRRHSYFLVGVTNRIWASAVPPSSRAWCWRGKPCSRPS